MKETVIIEGRMIAFVKLVIMGDRVMLLIGKKKAVSQDQHVENERSLLEELDRIYQLNADFGASMESGYLQGDTPLVHKINELLQLKNSQLREQFLLNSELIEYVTEMTYVKDMVDQISYQKNSINEIAATSQEMSTSSEEIANFVQNSLVKTKEVVEMSESSMQNIHHSFTHIDQSFDEMNTVQSKMQSVVEGTKEIDKVVNIIKDVADQTNLLSLNASIEAARSGESGKGFAVVADEIKKLSQNTKESVTYINNLLGNLREEIDHSNQKLIGAIDVFASGKEQINEAVTSMNEMEESLGEMNTTFDSIATNVEEQSAATEEVSARLSEINDQTGVLNDIVLKTGQGIYTISSMIENQRKAAIPYYKDFSGEQVLILVASEHLLWKWKAYNAVCGFVNLDESSIQSHDMCTVGKFMATNDISSDVKKLEEPHKKVHTLSKEIVRAVNNGDRTHIDRYLTELDEATETFISGLKNAQL
ncbi:methyl-accepting chemotaxis protein [Aquibacillus sediminis]|uniref:methyl-accepting chemotaxis protein n=1 Tax=Aquibacillus sediminis TaxID=2574734 RepID=UPI001486988C|nr:methyl-accepting chemotaxis protein [Aquibacillus sediminis]